MTPIQRLGVCLDLEGSINKVGELARDGRRIYFRYDPAFLAIDLNLSPFKLKWTDYPQLPNTQIFDGLFGVFNDSLPDGWGRLLLDRSLTQRGVDLNQIGPLDRLAHVGAGGLGALTYYPIQPAIAPQPADISLDHLAGAAAQVLQGESTVADIAELLILNGSSGGARPKILVGYQPSTGSLIPDAPVLPAGYEHWLIKFSALGDNAEAAEIELAYYRMARAAGLKMSECRLFSGAGGNNYFGTRRFDRGPNGRLHLHSAAGLLQDNFRLSNLDYGHLMDAAFRLQQRVAGYESIFRLAAFNVFAHNRDDHSKNVSFLMDESGWRPAPAYDLTFSRSSHGYHSTTVAGEGRTPGTAHLLKLAQTFVLKNADQLIDEVRTAVARWPDLAAESGVSKATIDAIGKVFRSIN